MTIGEIKSGLSALAKQFNPSSEENKLILGAVEALEQKSCEDAISRQAVLDIAKSSKSNWIDNSVLFKRVNFLPPVNPQPKTGHCKDCKWWKDSDGLYRRGVHAESQCPINRREVFEGNGYCYMYEPQESEVEK